MTTTARPKTLTLSAPESEALIAIVSEAFGVQLRTHGESDAKTQEMLALLMRVRSLRYADSAN